LRLLHNIQMPKLKSIDKPFLIIVISLAVSGFFLFLSASLGLTARDDIKFSSIVLNQLLLGLMMGGVFAFILSRVKYTFWQKYSFWIYIFSLVLTLLVFIPGIGLEHGGAKRWILIGPLSFQPSEFLKIAFVLYCAAWLSGIKNKVEDVKFGLIPLAIISGVAGSILLLQPDTDTFVIMLVAAVSMFVVAGGKWKHLMIIGLVGLIGLSGLVIARPYLKERVMTYINPASDPLESGYQIQQSLIAIGSGGVAGKGFGQSAQKFNFLPEPIGDSIFAVAAEEFGFIGASALVILYLLFALRGLRIASRTSNAFAGLVMIGLTIMITAQSFMNISAMLGLIPLSGLPLLFVSHGGTALFFTLFAVGIMLNISRYQRV
jgi:cell division protein FtsW